MRNPLSQPVIVHEGFSEKRLVIPLGICSFPGYSGIKMKDCIQHLQFCYFDFSKLTKKDSFEGDTFGNKMLLPSFGVKSSNKGDNLK